MDGALAKTGNSTSIEDRISKRSVQEIDRRIGVSLDDERTKTLRKAIKLVPESSFVLDVSERRRN